MLILGLKGLNGILPPIYFLNVSCDSYIVFCLGDFHAGNGLLTL